MTRVDRWRAGALATALCLVVLLCASAGSASASGPSTDVVQRVNQLRMHQGLRPLKVSPSLTRTSSRFAHIIVRTDRFAHRSRIMASSRFSMLGEVLGFHRGFRPGSARTVRGWSHSSVHRAALLNPRFTVIGAGRARGRLGRARATVWVVQLGRRR
jgi:uncharacterized protein YkwD